MHKLPNMSVNLEISLFSIEMSRLLMQCVIPLAPFCLQCKVIVWGSLIIIPQTQQGKGHIRH